MTKLTRLALALMAIVAARAGAQQPISIQHVRPNDQRGLNMYEPSKHDTVTFQGTRVVFGGAFRQDFQGLDHSNNTAAAPLIGIGHGFNNASANANLDVQLAKGIRVAMTSYLSARHHNETWVKDGYILMDASPIDNPILNKVMNYVTLKAGHFEVNYGDGHFRRTDNGNAVFNTLVGNYILDAFAPEISGELYVQTHGLMAMGGVSNGEEKGTVLNAQKRSPGFYGKLAADRQLSNDLRIRLSGSWYGQSRSANQVLFSGDRGGSRYYDVLENTA